MLGGSRDHISGLRGRAEALADHDLNGFPPTDIWQQPREGLCLEEFIRPTPQNPKLALFGTVGRLQTAVKMHRQLSMSLYHIPTYGIQA